tara:strand:- start:329 stop:1114 length:786 start_codon:yes stop_codon:yes gene_type:complete
MSNNFSESGYLILKNAIKKQLVQKIQNEIYNCIRISGKNKKLKYFKFCKKVSNLKSKEFDFTKPIFELLHYKKFLENIFLERKVYKALTDLLGKDLAYCTDPGANLNLPKKSDPKKNYFFKDWHQEIWSGASPSTVQIWTPLIQENAKSGQIELIEESHKWGHVPHKNKKPIFIPKNIKIKRLNLNCGDVIIFSTLLMHRSIATKSPRLALPCLVKNFKNKDYSFESNRSFHNFSYSEMTKIERILGNHYLSPFRLKNFNE